MRKFILLAIILLSINTYSQTKTFNSNVRIKKTITSPNDNNMLAITPDGLVTKSQITIDQLTNAIDNVGTINVNDLVPYTGATRNLNLGTRFLITNRLIVSSSSTTFPHSAIRTTFDNQGSLRLGGNGITIGDQGDGNFVFRFNGSGAELPSNNRFVFKPDGTMTMDATLAEIQGASSNTAVTKAYVDNVISGSSIAPVTSSTFISSNFTGNITYSKSKSGHIYISLLIVPNSTAAPNGISDSHVFQLPAGFEPPTSYNPTSIGFRSGGSTLSAVNTNRIVCVIDSSGLIRVNNVDAINTAYTVEFHYNNEF